jgi:hypothetical protein
MRHTDFAGGILLGMFVPFAAMFGGAGVLWCVRRIRSAVVYARPEHLTRRINLAAGFVGARRAYLLGGHQFRVALIVGRRYQVEEQASAVLLDEFLPRAEDWADKH